MGDFVAFWLQWAIVSAAPVDRPRLDQLPFGIDSAALAAILAMAAALLAGVVPVVWAVRRNPYSDLGVKPGGGAVASRVSMVQGRSFAATDRQGTMPTAIVSKDLARYAWPDSPAMGSA